MSRKPLKSWELKELSKLKSMGVATTGVCYKNGEAPFAFAPERVDPHSGERKRDVILRIEPQSSGPSEIRVTSQAWVWGREKPESVYNYLPVRPAGQVHWVVWDTLGNMYHLVPKGAVYPLDYTLRLVQKYDGTQVVPGVTHA